MDNHSDLLARGAAFLVLTCCVIDFNRFCPGKKSRYTVTLGVTSINAIMFTLPAVFSNSMIEIILACCGALVIMTLGYIYRQRTSIVIGFLTMIMMLVLNADNLIDILFAGNWLVLGSLGVVAIIGASLVERHGVTVKYWIKHRFTACE